MQIDFTGKRDTTATDGDVGGVEGFEFPGEDRLQAASARGEKTRHGKRSTFRSQEADGDDGS